MDDNINNNRRSSRGDNNENNASQDCANMDVDEHNKKASDHYAMEFRVVLDDEYRLPEHGRLMMYLHNQNGTIYPLEYSSKLNAYHLQLKMPVASYVHIYKFFVFMESTGEKIWEKVPLRDLPIWNRRCIIESEHFKNGHAVTFDAVFFQEKSEQAYNESLQCNLLKLIPCSSFEKVSEVNSSAIENLINLHDLWVKAYLSKKKFVNQYNYFCQEIGSPDFLNVLAHYFLGPEPAKSTAAAVFEKITLFLAIRKRAYYVIERSFESSFCLGMGLDGLDSEQYSLFLKIFDALKTYKFMRPATRNSFESTLKALLRQFEELPHYILVLPLLVLVEGSDSPSDNFCQKFRDKMRRSENDQKCLMEMKERVFLMSERFPWITRLYVQSLSLISVGELLNSDISHSLSSNLLLAKFAYFWRQLKQSDSIETLTEEVFTCLYSRLHDNVKKRIREFDFEKGLQHDEKDFIETFLNICLKIPKEMKEYLNKPSTADLSYFAYTFSLCDGIIEYATVTVGKVGSETILSKVTKLQKEMLSVAKYFIGSGFTYPIKPLDIALWNCLSEIEWSDDKFAEEWRKVIREAMVTATQRYFTDDRKLIEYYCDKFEESGPNKRVSEWVTELVSNAFVDFVQSWALRDLAAKTWDKMKQTLPGFHSKAVILCEKILKNQFKNCPKYEANERLRFLQFIEEWNILFLQTIYVEAFSKSPATCCIASVLFFVQPAQTLH